MALSIERNASNQGETVVDCLIAWAKRASAENGDSVAISDGIRFAEELQQKMAQLENLSSQAEMEEMPLANKECETPQRGIRSKLNSRKVKKKRGITGVVSDEDLNASSPVLVEEGKILPASDDWLIDDIGITKQNKRRKCDILSWVEEGNRLNRSTFETSNYERPKLEPRQTRKRKQRHEDQNVDTCEDVSLPSQEHDSVVSVASTLPQSYQSPPTSGASTMRIKVKILDKLLLIPVPKG